MDIGSLATVFRAFRVGRALRLVKRAETLRKLAKTLLATLPGLVNIGALLFMLFYVYAVMGMQLFAKVQYGEFIGEQANMQTFWNAMLLLFRASTGENWNGIMYVRESR
jgi:voltage-dependent calcium channel L type alpha-1D